MNWLPSGDSCYIFVLRRCLVLFLSRMYSRMLNYTASYVCTVVWFKLVVGNIHEKNFRGKKFSS